MKTTVRRLCALLLILCLCMSLSGCMTRKKKEELAAYEAGMAKYEQDSARLSAILAEAETAEQTRDEYIACENALINGESFVLVRGGEYTAEAQVPENMRVDYWLVNGERVEGGETLSLQPQGNTVVEPVFRPEKRLRSVNSEMWLLDENGEPVGESFTELCFESDCINPVTGQPFDGSVSVKVFAPTDMLTTVDNWIVNDMALDAYLFVLEFKAYDITEATTFEPKFAACYLRHEADDPYDPMWGPLFEAVPLAFDREGR